MRRYLTLFLVGFLSVSLWADSKKLNHVSDLISFGSRFIGTRYVHGGAAPGGFDCSGFTSYVFGHFGYRLSRTAAGQAGDATRITRSNILPGDLVFFEGRAHNRHIGHVGIVTEVNDGYFRFIHASCSRGITISRSTESYYASRVLGFGRVLKGVPQGRRSSRHGDDSDISEEEELRAMEAMGIDEDDPDSAVYEQSEMNQSNLPNGGKSEMDAADDW